MDTDTQAIDDGRLLAQLSPDARDVLQEIVRRGERMVPTLLEALNDPKSAPTAREALAGIGRPALEPLRGRKDVDSLVALAEKHPVLQGEILDFFRGVVEDREAAEEVRHKAASGLLRFARPGDIDFLGDTIPPLRSLIREEFARVSVTGHEDDYQHILRPIEESLVDAYRWNRALTMADARRAVGRVLERLPEAPDEPLARVIFGRLHRAAARAPGRMSIMEISACLKRVLVSIKTREDKYLPSLDETLP